MLQLLDEIQIGMKAAGSFSILFTHGSHTPLILTNAFLYSMEVDARSTQCFQTNENGSCRLLFFSLIPLPTKQNELCVHNSMNDFFTTTTRTIQMVNR